MEITLHLRLWRMTTLQRPEGVIAAKGEGLSTGRLATYYSYLGDRDERLESKHVWCTASRNTHLYTHVLMSSLYRLLRIEPLSLCLVINIPTASYPVSIFLHLFEATNQSRRAALQRCCECSLATMRELERSIHPLTWFIQYIEPRWRTFLLETNK